MEGWHCLLKKGIGERRKTIHVAIRDTHNFSASESGGRSQCQCLGLMQKKRVRKTARKRQQGNAVTGQTFCSKRYASKVCITYSANYCWIGVLMFIMPQKEVFPVPKRELENWEKVTCDTSSQSIAMKKGVKIFFHGNHNEERYDKELAIL